MRRAIPMVLAVLALAVPALGKDAPATRPASGPSTRASEQDAKIAKGLRRGYVVVGMTLKQVEEVCGKGELQTAGEHDETWVYYPLDVHHDWLGDGATQDTGATERIIFGGTSVVYSPVNLPIPYRPYRWLSTVPAPLSNHSSST
jgi:hypothetical protein